MTTSIQKALYAFAQREEAKVAQLQSYLEAGVSLESKDAFNQARQELSQSPDKLYLLIGRVVASSPALVQLHKDWIEAVERLTDTELQEYLSHELLAKRVSDNQMAQTIFSLLTECKNK